MVSPRPHDDARSQLSGATEGLVVYDPAVRLWMVTRLMTCQKHHGVHHFAIVGEGQQLWMSPDAVNCLGIDEAEDARILRLVQERPDSDLREQGYLNP